MYRVPFTVCGEDDRRKGDEAVAGYDRAPLV